MQSIELISEVTPALRLSDKVSQGLSWMDDFHVRHLAVLGAEGEYMGLVSEEMLLNAPADVSLGELGLLLPRPAVSPRQHVLDALRVLYEGGYSVLPVVDEHVGYMGVITYEALVRYFGGSDAVLHPGGVLVLEAPKRHYSMAEIARLAEGEHAVILSSMVTSEPDAEFVEVTLKLNRSDVQRVAATLERFGYTVKGAFDEDRDPTVLRERYDLLMSYLEV